MTITYNDLYLRLRRRLRELGVDAATLEARELVCCATGKSRQELVRDGNLYASAEVEDRVEALLERHLAGEPVAYIIGEWEFYGLPLDITTDVLIPRPDSEILAELAIDYLRPLRECRVLDLCAGSGCLGLAAASQVPQAHVVLGEFDDCALKICRQNIRRNGLSGRAVPVWVDALHEPDPDLGVFQCILCNPPYIPAKDIQELDASVRDFEPHLALDGGPDGLDFYRAITANWKRVLVPGGRLYFEVGTGQAETVSRLMEARGFEDVQIREDLHGIPRVVFGERGTGNDSST